MHERRQLKKTPSERLWEQTIRHKPEDAKDLVHWEGAPWCEKERLVELIHLEAFREWRPSSL
jgi:hypothetical protein